MKKIWLERIKIKQFKGINDFELEFTSSPFVIKGENATNKTSIFDAFLWAVTGKNSLGKNDFQILPTDKNNKIIPGNTAEVELNFDINEDGTHKKIRLKKTFQEKFTKKRSFASLVKTGHVKSYYINDMNNPIKEKDYRARIEGIFPLDIFKKLTDPAYFLSLPWEKQRAELFNICGVQEDTESDILQDDKYNAISEEIKEYGYTLSEYLKSLKSQRLKVKKETEELPVRISEVKESLKEIDRPLIKTKTALQMHLKKLQIPDEKDIRLKALQQKQEQYESRITYLENRIDEIKSAAEREKNREIEALQYDIRKKQTDIEEKKTKILFYNKQLDGLRVSWENTQNKKIELEKKCSLCGQDLPDVQQLQIYKTIKNAKAEKLKNIESEGKDIKNKRTALELEIENIANKIKKQEKEIESLEATEIDALPFFDTKTYAKIKQEKTELHGKLKDIKVSPDILFENKEGQTDKEDKQEKIKAISLELEAWEKQKAEYDLMKEQKERIKTLRVQQKEKTMVFSTIIEKISLTESALKVKILNIAEDIGDKFTRVKWKLFDEKINGEVTPCCEAMVDGVLCHHGLNNGAKINAGLEIIKVLQQHYQCNFTIFIDNSECLSELTDMADTQLILLKVVGDELTNNNAVYELTKGV